MKLITEIGNQAKQIMTIVQDNGEQFVLGLEYRPTQQSWYFSVMKDAFLINNHKLVQHPNLLRKYINQINFGLMVVTLDGQEPFNIDDFSLKRTSLYLLNNSECNEVETIFYAPYNESGTD